MSTHPTFQDTMPAPLPSKGKPPALPLLMTKAENDAFNAGRAFQEPISVLEGARMGKLSWFCLGMLVGIAVMGTLRSCGLAP